MENVIKIIIDGNAIADLVMESFRNSIPKIDASEENLQSVNSKRVMQILGIGKSALDNLIDSKILEPTKVGDGYRYPLWMIKKYQEDYKGYDLTTLSNCKVAKEKVESIKNATCSNK